MSVPYISTLVIEDAHKSDIYAVCTTPRYTVSASGDGNILLWSNSAPDQQPVCLTQEPIKSGVHHLAADPDGKTLLAVAFDSSLAAFDLTSLKPLKISNIDKSMTNAGAWACAVAANGFAAVSTLRGAIFLLDLHKDTVLKLLVEPGMAVVGAKTEPTENKEAGTTGDADGTTEVGEEVHIDENAVTTGRPCLTVDISPDRTFVVGAYEGGRCRVFRVETGRVAFSLPSHITRPRCARFSPNGQVVAVTGDASVALFTLSGGSYLGSLLGHETYIYSIAFDADGERLLSVSGDGKMKVWSMSSRECLATVSINSLPVFTCAWVPARSNIIVGSEVGFVAAGVDRALSFFREASGSANPL